MNLVCTGCITDEMFRQDKELQRGKAIELVARDSKPVVTIYDGHALCENHYHVKLLPKTYRFVSVSLTGPDRNS